MILRRAVQAREEKIDNGKAPGTKDLALLILRFILKYQYLKE